MTAESSAPDRADLFATLVYLADSLVTGTDVIDLADHLVHSCVELIDVDHAGILVDDQRGSLRLLAATSGDPAAGAAGAAE